MSVSSALSPILLVADHKWRDLPGMTLLKMVLEDRYGLPAVVTSYAGVSACLRLFHPRAVALTTLIGPREQALARAARHIGAAVIVIPTEGIPGSRESMAGIFRNAPTWEMCDLYLPWGPVMAQFAVDEGYLPKDKVRLTGTGRFDFYQPPLSQCLMSRSLLEQHFGLRSRAPVVTWATTFVLASYAENEKRLRYTERDLAARGLSQIEGFANLAAIAKKEQEAKALVLDSMRTCCESLPEAEFLIKPHPYEEFALYESLVADCRRAGIQNCHLAADVYIWDILKHATAHVHSGSTTGMEAWLMGVSTINFQPGGYARFKCAVGGALVEQEILDDTQTLTEGVLQRLRHYVNGGIAEPEVIRRRGQFLDRWFHVFDGHAAERQAAAIADLLKNHSRSLERGTSPQWVGRRAPLTYLQYRVNQLLGREFDAPFFERGGSAPLDFLGQRDKVVRQRDVAQWTANIRKAQTSVP